MPYETTPNSSCQNIQEFAAGIGAVLICGRDGMKGFVAGLVGDSVSTLTWASHDRASTMQAKEASLG